MESEDRVRFQTELEFVQSLANPHYLHFLAQREYFKQETFINYLRYLRYWTQPEYAKHIVYPQCLFILELLEQSEFRETLAHASNVKFIDEQLILAWTNYQRRRSRILQNVATSNANQPQGQTQ